MYQNPFWYVFILSQYKYIPVLTIDEFINLLSDFKYNIMEEQYRNFEYDLLVELGKTQFILTYEKICGDGDNIVNFRILNMSAL